MNRKLRNMEYLLNFGSFILLFAILFVIGNLGEGIELVKCVLGVICSLGVILLSYMVGNSLKMDRSAKLIHFEGLFLLIWFFIFAGEMSVFGEWFSFYGDGAHIFYAVLFFLVSTLLVLTKVRFKEYQYINMSYVSTIIGIYHLFKFLDLSYLSVSMILIAITFIPYMLSKNDKTFNFLRYILDILIIYSILLLFNEETITVVNIASLILCILVNSVLAIRSKDLESKYFSLIIYYAFFFVIGSLFSNVLSDEIVMVLVAFFACIIDLALNYFIKYFGRQALTFNKIVYTVFITILCISSLSLHYTALVIISLFVFISSITVLKLFKDDKSEKYFFPLKTGLFVYSLILLFSQNVFVVPDLIGYFILNGLYLILYKFSKDDKVRVMNAALVIILLFLSLGLGVEDTIVNYLAVLCIMLLDYLILIVGENKDNSLLGKVIYTIMLVVSMGSLLSYEVGNVKYLMQTIFLLVLFLSSDKIKYNVGITIPLITINLCNYIGSVIESYVLVSILTNLIIIISIVLFTVYMLERDKDRDLFLSIILGILMGSFIIGNGSDMLLAIYAISIIVVGIISALKINYKKLYITGICLGVLSLVMILLSIEGIPASVYLLLLGIGVIGFAIYMIAKYQKAENEKIRYCEECGTKLVGRVDNCTNCGKKVVD